jgi:hypothetical protein
VAELPLPPLLVPDGALEEEFDEPLPVELGTPCVVATTCWTNGFLPSNWLKEKSSALERLGRTSEFGNDALAVGREAAAAVPGAVVAGAVEVAPVVVVAGGGALLAPPWWRAFGIS